MVIFMPYVDQGSRVKVAGSWHHLFHLFMDLDCVSLHKHTKEKNLANIQPSWPYAWLITHMCNKLKTASVGPSGPYELIPVSVAKAGSSIFTPLDGMLVHRRVKFASTHLYPWVEKGTMRVKCLAQECKQWPQPGLEPRLFDPESSELNIKPPCPHYKLCGVWGVNNQLIAT